MTKLKLVTVTCKFDYVIVVPEDEIDDPYSYAYDEARDAFNDLSPQDMQIHCVPYERYPAQGWDGDCIPYGGDGNTRTKEYL
jgi:hypothetical protein